MKYNRIFCLVLLAGSMCLFAPTHNDTLPLAQLPQELLIRIPKYSENKELLRKKLLCVSKGFSEIFDSHEAHKISNDDYACYCAVRKIADLYFAQLIKENEYCKTIGMDECITDDRESIIIYINQTKKGIVLEINYDYKNLSGIITPWGVYEFYDANFSDIAYRKIFGEFCKKITVQPSKIMKKSFDYLYFDVIALEGKKLPIPEKDPNPEEDKRYLWDIFSKIYKRR